MNKKRRLFSEDYLGVSGDRLHSSYHNSYLHFFFIFTCTFTNFRTYLHYTKYIFNITTFNIYFLYFKSISTCHYIKLFYYFIIKVTVSFNVSFSIDNVAKLLNLSRVMYASTLKICSNSF